MQVFKTMAKAQQEQSLVVLDWGVANATLEEVFIKFAHKIGIDRSPSNLCTPSGRSIGADSTP